MKLFAALERALLARWRKIKVALKINKWPLLSLKEQRLQLKKQYLESLFRKKWQKFERSIYDVYRSAIPHLGLAIIQRSSLTETHDSLETHRNKDVTHMRRRLRHVKCGFTLTRHVQHGRNIRLNCIICVSISHHLLALLRLIQDR